MAALRIECSFEGALPRSGAVVCNHLSYLDIVVMSSIAPFVMVAKSEVRGWPLLGWLTARAGTVYVERGGGPATYPAVNRAMAEAYRSGLPVLFFPEGTTTDGAYADGGVMPFRRGLFHSVLNEQVTLRAAALRYSLEDGNEGATIAQDICWWGDMLLGPHLFRFLGLRGVRADVRFGGEVLERTDRFALSASARAAIAEMYEGFGECESGAVGYEAELVEAL
ncbi:MAG: phospholipid/glycerol acyltransferase [Acidobacteriaceae bacterium]|nr:phospholipid/glycerol acyltransferase [Acidobacteriaceae bacterium]